MMKGHIMEHTFETVEQADFDPPPGLEGWLYVAGFSPLLPDRLNVALLRTKAIREMPGAAMVMCTEGPEEYDGEVVTAVHVLIAPDEPELAAWMQTQLDIIDRDGILDEEAYWPMVNPILQTLWEEASPAARVQLCSSAGADPACVFEDELPSAIHGVLYKQISE